jgi:gamma-glutamyltranspeptidase
LPVVSRNSRIFESWCSAAGFGYEVLRSPLTYAFAGVHGITMFDGRLEGGADPQRDGYAAGVV